MTEKITESAIEKCAIDLLEKQGFVYIYAPDVAPDTDSPQRESFGDVILLEHLRLSATRINPEIPLEVLEDAIKQILRLNSPDLITNNESFHRMLTEGIKVNYQKDGEVRGDYVWLIDFKNPENNDFVVSNQFTVIENGLNKRPDIILFVNGIPLVVIELKNPVDENATVNSAFKQFHTYKQTIPSLFTYNGFMVISDGLEAKAGTISAGFSRFMAWKTSDGKVEASPLIGQLETLIRGMLNKETLVDLIRHFIVFEKSKKEDTVSGQITIQTVKKLAAYHQYYAVNMALESTLRASGYLPKSVLCQEEPTPGPTLEGNKSFPGEGGAKRRKGSFYIEANEDIHNGLLTLEEPRRRILPYNPHVAERAKELRKNMTLSEVLLWKYLKGKQIHGFDFDRQRPIDQFVVDFYCKDLMLAIEIDGSSHDGEESQIKDGIRQERLESFGVRFLRFDDRDVKREIDGVVKTISEWVLQHKNDLVGVYGTEDSNGSHYTSESPASYGVAGVGSQPVGDRKGGVVWHTQGSGKSLSMVFYTGKIVLALDNPTIVVITDRNDLDDQLFDTFAASKQLLRQEPIQAEDREKLKDLLKVASGGIVFTTIQKFQPSEGNSYEKLSQRKNIIVIADEAHRTQYGFKAKTVDDKDNKGNIVGKKIVYGFAKYLRDALPHATCLGFTGTPIENADVNTPAVFGNYVDVYDISQAVEDGATVRIYYESRLAKITLSAEGKQLVSDLDDDLQATLSLKSVP